MNGMVRKLMLTARPETRAVNARVFRDLFFMRCTVILFFKKVLLRVLKLYHKVIPWFIRYEQRCSEDKHIGTHGSG